jgi:hypothetical protein
MPSEVCIFRSDERSDGRSRTLAQREWCKANGVDPDVWHDLSKILTANRRVHAQRFGELSAGDRARLHANPDYRSDWTDRLRGVTAR